jgi:signal transduction histidine kinase/CheY-like chemotaxis protein
MNESPTRPPRSLSWPAIQWLLYLALAFAAQAIIIVVERDRASTISQARTDQREKASSESRQIAAHLERYFDQIYRGIRTIARLPAVREIDRHGLNFDERARAGAQEVYNNLAETVRISEVYIVPVDFDPDAIDPYTGKPQEPITTFDELIVGRTADTRSDARGRSDAPVANPQVEEIEIYEYRLMRRQIAILRERFPTESEIDQLSYPAIIGEEVITCDNRFYSPSHPNDDDRRGLVISIPFYGADGKMRGIVSAVVLTSAIRSQLPQGIYEIRNERYSLRIADSASADAAHGAVIAFAETQPLAFRDATGGWQLNSAVTEAAFDLRPDVVGSNDKALTRLIAVLITFAALFSIVRLTAQRHRDIEARSAMLEQRVAERTGDLEIARREAEAANLAKTRFLANMSHEIRTPMSAVLGTVDLLSRSGLGSEHARHLATIRSSGQALLDLINQLLDLSAVETGRVTLSPAPQRLRCLVQEVVTLFEPAAREGGLRLDASIGESVPDSIWVDGGRLRQILVNLLSNAIKFTSSGGVTITAERQPGGETGVDMLRIAVTDTGRGFPPAIGSSIFDSPATEPVASVAPGAGAGLGLRISRSLVEQMGGRIGCENPIEGGGRVFFTIPLRPANDDQPAHADTTMTEAGRVSQADVRALAGLRVLLVEDNATLAALTREILVKAGCSATILTDGADCIAALDREPYDLVLMDCRLQGMDGIAAAREIRSREQAEGRHAIPIVALTANAFDWDREACLAAGMDDFLCKPFTAVQLIDALARNTARRDTSSARTAVNIH